MNQVLDISILISDVNIIGAIYLILSSSRALMTIFLCFANGLMSCGMVFGFCCFWLRMVRGEGVFWGWGLLFGICFDLASGYLVIVQGCCRFVTIFVMQTIDHHATYYLYQLSTSPQIQ